MTQILKPKQLAIEIEELNQLWSKEAEYISKTVTQRNPSVEVEMEYASFCGDILRKVALVADNTAISNTFTEKVTDFLLEVYSLQILLDYPDFQVNLLRERWNSIQMDINRLLSNN